MPRTSAMNEEEIRLIDVWRILARQKKWVWGIPAVTVACALAFVLVVSPQWEATAVIQIGQVGQGAVGLGRPLVESPPRAIERMKLNAFRDAVLADLKIPSDEDNPEARLYRASLKLKLLPDTDLIELRVRGRSREDAEKWAQATVARLRDVHQELARPSIQRLEVQLMEVKQDLERTEAMRANLIEAASVKGRNGPGYRFAENVLLANILNSRDAEIRHLRERMVGLQEQLSPARTYPTSLIDRVHVPEKPVFPKKTSSVVLAGMLGSLLGFLMAFISDYVQRTRSAVRQRNGGGVTA